MPKKQTNLKVECCAKVSLGASSISKEHSTLRI